MFIKNENGERVEWKFVLLYKLIITIADEDGWSFRMHREFSRRAFDWNRILMKCNDKTVFAKWRRVNNLQFDSFLCSSFLQVFTRYATDMGE